MIGRELTLKVLYEFSRLKIKLDDLNDSDISAG